MRYRMFANEIIQAYVYFIKLVSNYIIIYILFAEIHSNGAESELNVFTRTHLSSTLWPPSIMDLFVVCILVNQVSSFLSRLSENVMNSPPSSALPAGEYEVVQVFNEVMNAFDSECGATTGRTNEALIGVEALYDDPTVGCMRECLSDSMLRI